MSILTGPGTEARGPSGRHLLLLQAALLSDQAAREAFNRWSAEGGAVSTTAADARHLLGLVYANLSALGVDEDLSELRAFHRGIWARNQRLFHSLGPLLDAFDATSIEVLALKGAALLATLGLDAGVRPMGDVDVLVHPDHVETAFALAMEGGWRLQHPHQFEGGLPRLRRIRHSVDLGKGAGEAIDLHWWPMRETAGSFDVWSSAGTARLVDREVLVPNPTVQFVIACVHGTSWVSTPWRWVPDAVLLARGTEIDWNAVVEHALDIDVAADLGRCLELLRDRFDVEVPSEIIAHLSARQDGALDRILRRQRTRPAGALRQAAAHVDLARRLGRHPYPFGSPKGTPSYVLEMVRLLGPGRAPGHLVKMARDATWS